MDLADKIKILEQNGFKRAKMRKAFWYKGEQIISLRELKMQRHPGQVLAFIARLQKVEDSRSITGRIPTNRSGVIDGLR